MTLPLHGLPLVLLYLFRQSGESHKSSDLAPNILRMFWEFTLGLTRIGHSYSPSD